MLRQYVNERWLNLAPDKAVDGDLDLLASMVGLTRLVGESNENLRVRIAGFPDSKLTPATASSYRPTAIASDAKVVDANTRVTIATRTVDIAILATDNANGNPNAATLTATQAYMRDPERHLLGWTVNVVAPVIQSYAITGQVWYDASKTTESDVRSQVESSMKAYVRGRRVFGANVYVSAVQAALHTPLVDRATVSLPTADLTLSVGEYNKVFYCPDRIGAGAIQITYTAQ